MIPLSYVLLSPGIKISKTLIIMIKTHAYIQRYESISLTVGDKLWWADQGTDQIGTCDKKDGGNWKVLRNSTSPMMHMRIYDEDVQKGKKKNN